MFPFSLTLYIVRRLVIAPHGSFASTVDWFLTAEAARTHGRWENGVERYAVKLRFWNPSRLCQTLRALSYGQVTADMTTIETPPLS